MIQAGTEARVKIQQIIENQLPSFILEESPKTVDFLRQYYISQEYQGGPVDILENLDQYIKLDNLIPEVVVGSTVLTNDIDVKSDVISVTSTKGFPQNYGLIKIDDEIITYTGITTNTFTGCIRGFSGVTSYHQNLNSEELVFSTSQASSHTAQTSIKNLSSLFLQEFYKKIKYSLTPGLENLDFVPDLNVGNFIKSARTLYESKGTEESFRILFNVLFGETPKVIDLEQFLIKPSSASYLRRDVVVVDAISGDPLNLVGQTIIKKNDSTTTAAVSEVETIGRGGKTYYKLLLFVGYDDAFPTITGSFTITGSTKNSNIINISSSTITVDSTIGFPESGSLYSGNNIITYTSKSVNQFFGCDGITEIIPSNSIIRSDETYYGYENGDLTKKVEFRITGVLSDYMGLTDNSVVEEGEYIGIRNLGEDIKIPIDNPTYKEIFANSWNYNTTSKIATASNINFEYPDIASDVQNTYNENDEYMYVASNSLPSYQITNKLFSYNASGVSDFDSITGLYGIITFNEKVSFITGSEVYYESSNSTISGLEAGYYFVEVLSDKKQIRLYYSRSVIGTENYIKFGELSLGSHNFTLRTQKEKILSPQKILRKFPLSVDIGDGESDETPIGSIGMLINGVEIFGYKSDNKIYYGPLEKINILNGGQSYDVINPPSLQITTGSAKVLPVVSGSLEKIYIDPQEFDIDIIVSVALTGGNGRGASFEPIIQKRRREIEFDARLLENGGGIDATNETITFTSNHGLINGESVVYRPGNNPLLGIGTYNGSNTNTGKTLKKESTYYIKYINDKTIQLYNSLSDYNSGINTVGFTTIGTSGIQKFATQPKNTLTEIKVLNGGENYTNREIRVSPSGISTATNIITFNNHGFESGEIIVYNYETSPVSGLSSSHRYQVIKIDSNTFSLADAGIGGTSVSDYQRGRVIPFNSTGSGYQIFNYPKINLGVEYCAVGLGSTQFRGTINATPIVRGEIIGVNVYEHGQDYGSNILNLHKKPEIAIKTGKSAQLSPIIINGRIESVNVQYGGVEYHSIPDIVISGSGKGAVLRPVVENQKIVGVIVVGGGSGYSESDTKLIVKSTGKNAIFDPQVRSLSVNTNILYNDVTTSTKFANEIVRSSYNNLQYGICGYSGVLQTHFGDNGSSHSPIIGWAYDGNPIYGAYGYSDPGDKNSPIKKLVSGYTLSISNVENRPSPFTDGFFISDYKFTNSGDLDQYNGRYCITPEFPNGVYAYFATSTIDDNANVVGSFPYFIGDQYRSKFITENRLLNQSFNFNSSNLIRNIHPFIQNFIYNSENRVASIDSVLSGSINSLEIINSGDNYKVGDSLAFDESETGGGGLSCIVSEINGKNIVDIQTTTQTYNDAIFTWNGQNEIGVKITPTHSLDNLDYVSISGITTTLSNLNGYYQIGISTYQSIITQNIPATGNVTDIYVANVPANISIGSSIGIGTETLRVLNVYGDVIRVLRGNSGLAHTATSTVTFAPDSFVINKKTDYFESKNNDLVHFNPRSSVGVGTTSGIGIGVTYNIGISTNTIISIPTQSIYLPNHSFKNNQQVILRKPSGASAISVANTSGSTSFNLPLSGDFQTVYVIRKSVDHIGIATQIGLTTTSNGLFFTSNGSDDYQYSFESTFTQVKGNIEKNTANVSLTTSHQLISGDVINLNVQPSLSVGVGTSSSIKVARDTSTGWILVNPVGFSSIGINTITNEITLPNHNLKTGDKVKYTADLVASGINTGYYYVYKIDSNKIKLCETKIDSEMYPPTVVSIVGTGGSNQKLYSVNPELISYKNNNLVFDLSDSSLIGYKFKIFYDESFRDEFISTGTENTFAVTGIGTIGISPNASLTVKYNQNTPYPLFYTLEKAGYISTADITVNNHSRISLIDSLYNGSYKISGIGSTTFSFPLTQKPERNLYSQSECDTLTYSTISLTETGGVSKVKILSPGDNYKKLPTFTSILSENGQGAYIAPKSNTIGKINKIKILDEGYEYSSDKTLKPQAEISNYLLLKNSNYIKSVSVVDGGNNYNSSPDLIVIDSTSGQKINSGNLKAILSGNSIISVDIIDSPKGLPEIPVTIKSINNTNGVSIQSLQYSNSGIVTCALITPLNGFSIEPFAIGDKIYVEGIQKETSDGDGFNSEDHEYDFFVVSNYQGSGATQRVLEYNLSGITTNPGTLKVIDNLYGKIINYNNYPQFEVVQDFSQFVVGERFQVNTQFGYVETDLRITKSDKNYIKVIGDYDLQSNDIIKGIKSGFIATINSIKKSSGYFIVDFASRKDLGWSNDTGKLNLDTQVIPDNYYYQNLSYTVKSSQTWENIVSPVNGLLHTSGLKNFADTEILNTTSVGIGSTDYSISLYDIIDESRVDTIYNFDLTRDINVSGDTSKFLEFKSKKFSDYIECRTNRVLEIDDISSQFSTSDASVNTDPFVRIDDITPSKKYDKYLVQVTNNDFTDVQFTELIVLTNGSNVYTLEKGSIDSETTDNTGYASNKLANIYGYSDELGGTYLRFEPVKDPYHTTYNIKYLNTSFENYTTGIGTSSIGFINLIGLTKNVASGITTTLVSELTSKIKSFYSEINIIDNSTNEINYVEIFVDHDGTNTNISEFYFDTEDGFSSNFIGSFGATINSDILSLNYTNISNNHVTVRTRNVGFGTTAVGVGTYRFKAIGQLDGTEKTVKYESLYSNVSVASSIVSFDKTKFSSLKSVIRVGLGQTSALHQVMMICDGSSTQTIQYPFLSIGSTSGIGTFGGEISGTTASLKFYPDVDISGNFEILSFNQEFYSQNDYIDLNQPPDLTYSNANESFGIKKYFAVNDGDINKLNFDLKYQNRNIFKQVFDPSNSTILNPVTGEFNIQHFFSTGEELTYTAKSTFDGINPTSVGIGTTLNNVGVTTNILPQTVYAIKINPTKFKISTRKDYALLGIAVTFANYGSGNAHELEAVKKNEKSIITINNVIQSPIAYSLVDYTVNNGGSIGVTTTIFGLSGISSISLGDIIKIDSEYMKVSNVGLGTTYSGPISFGGTFPLVEVKRGFVGSSATSHTNSSAASIYRGSYNIVGNEIYFTEAPDGSLADQLGIDFDNLPESRATFSGRVFLKNDYTENRIYDNITEKFTGIGQTYTLTVGGANTTGIGTTGGNGIVLINGIFQTPTTDNNPNNNFKIIENSGISSIVFSGIRTDGEIFISQSDVNMNQLPRGGMIVSLGSTPGLGYAPLVGAAVTAIVSGGSITSIGIGTTGNWGSGYRSPVSIAVTESGHTGVGATISAIVGAGGTLSFNIIGGGTGYNNPSIIISPPNYENLSVTGVSRLGIGSTSASGTGLLINVDVGASSTTGIGSTLFEVKNFKISRPGYGFKKGDVIKPVGLVTAYGLSSPLSEFQLTVLDVFNDSFAAWQFGRVDYIDSIKNLQDGIRIRFPLYYNSQLLSFETNDSDLDSQLIDFNSLLIIFINGVLQKPGDSYNFNGGTTFSFTEAPKPEDDVAIFFYRGSDGDSTIVNVNETIKIGDGVQVFSSNANLQNTITQDLRTISNISSSDTIQTELYQTQGIDSLNYKPLSWSKQKVDKIIDGQFVSKSRDSIESQIYPTAKVIKNLTPTDTTICVDDVQFFNYENEVSPNFGGLIISGSPDPVSAAVTAVVSAGGTIQSLVIETPGSGYLGSSVSVRISAPPRVGVGIGTTATATIAVVNGSLSTPITITNPGFGYTTSIQPGVIVPLPSPSYENISNITSITGVAGSITGIGSTVGIGTALAIKFTLSDTTGLSVGQPIYIFNTKVGNGVTSIYTTNSNAIGIGTTFLDNIYNISAINSSVGIITCNVHSDSNLVGITTTGVVGNFSWGKLTGFTRSSSPISIAVSGYNVDSGLSTFPTIQRRGYGLRDTGAIKK
jgi:hypothetical protein